MPIQTFLKLLLPMLFGIASQSLAELHERGNGLVYDDILDVTWVADIQLAKTLGYNPSNRNFSFRENEGDDYLSHDQALEFIEALNTESFNGQLGYLGFTGWRLPKLHLTEAEREASTFTAPNPAGVRNMGRNIVDPRQELSHFYNVSLGGSPSASPPADCQSNSDGGCIWSTASLGLFINTDVLNITDAGLLAQGKPTSWSNAVRDAWTSFFYEEISLLADPDNPGEFIPKPNRVFKLIGRQGYQDDQALTFGSLGGGGRVWAVHDGDIGIQLIDEVSVPFPGVSVLLLAALILGVVGRYAK